MGFDLIFILILWSIIGASICFIWGESKHTDRWELCNPYWAYKYYKKLNWFGAIILSLFYSALCPIGAVCYWFHKLCIIGRK